MYVYTHMYTTSTHECLYIHSRSCRRGREYEERTQGQKKRTALIHAAYRRHEKLDETNGRRQENEQERAKETDLLNYLVYRSEVYRWIALVPRFHY